MPPAASWRAGGVRLGETIVHCDARGGRELAFLSHALRALPEGGLGKLVASPRTIALLTATGERAMAHALPVPMGRPLSLGALRLELFPSGHLPGAAQLVVTEPSGRRILYAGDVQPGEPGLGEPCEVRGADAVVLAAPLALVEGRLPPRAEALVRLVELVRGALADGRVPVVLAPPLGVMQEAMRALHAAGVPLRAHREVMRFTQAWSSTQAAPRPVLPVLQAPSARGTAKRGRAAAALLWPAGPEPRPAGSPSLARLVPAERAFRVALTGLALDEGYARRAGVEASVPLSDHGDLHQVLEFLRHTGARRAFVTAGYGPRLVEAAAALSLEVEPLGPPRQLSLLG